MTTVEDHLRKYPHARASTIAYLRAKEETTSKLMREIREQQEANERLHKFRDKIGYVAWFKRLIGVK